MPRRKRDEPAGTRRAGTRNLTAPGRLQEVHRRATTQPPTGYLLLPSWGDCGICTNSTSLTTNWGTYNMIDTTWSQWIISAQGTSANTTWTLWHDEAHQTIQLASNNDVRRYAQRVISSEERESWERQEREYRARLAKLQAERDAAEARAEQLLKSILSPEQKDDFESKKFFYLETVGKDGTKQVYRIDKGTHGNVKLMSPDKKKVLGQFCVQPADVPVCDAVAAQVLHLRHNEDGFKRAANFTRFQ